MLRFEPINQGRFAVLHMGFRPFFLAAILGAMALGALWTAIYSFGLPLLRADYSFISWHAHEMIFGYAFAVVAGFLLTAVRNWTGIQTINGVLLLLLLLMWLAGRIFPFIAFIPFWYLTVHELVFMALVLFFAMKPLLEKSQWKQVPILVFLGLMMLASLLFHLGLTGVIGTGPQLGLYLGLYIYIALILTMGRRVIPGFIENAIGGGFQAKNRLWLDWLSRGVFVLFLVTELLALFSGSSGTAFISSIFALMLFILHAYRLFGWHHRSIWLHPLLWSLYLAYAWISVGFLLKFLVIVANMNPWVAVHAFAYGGIGLITAGMMARVTLGHTGRNVFAPPASLGVWLGILMVGALLRVIMVWIWPAEYQVWILAAQLMWITGFTGLAVIYVPMLLKARIDGEPG